jgi:three-Cys-motif partner protein
MSTYNEINAVHSAHMPIYVDENPEYWDDYDNLQRVKHQLLRGYLGGWFPILGSWSGRIVYIDCNAGRGKHRTGQPGSPLIAISTFLGHPFRDRILKNCEVSFFFIEADKENQQNLEKIMRAIKRPPKVSITTKLGEFEAIISTEIDRLKAQNARLAPAFVFVDPYGFRLPGKLLAQLKAFEKCELFITFMWRWIDMAIRHPEQAENMDALFITPKWRSLLTIEDSDQRCEAAIRLLCSELGARYSTRIKMLGDNGATKYVLIHATNHPRGRELMLEVMWKICPKDGFRARMTDNPNQEFLIKPEPNLQPVKIWLRRFQSKAISYEEIWQQIQDSTEGIPYLRKHLNIVLREMLKAKEIKIPAEKSFVAAHNPTIHFVGNVD